MKRFTRELEPPYYAAVFEARQGNDSGNLDGRVRTAQEMVALASRIPGFLGVKTAESRRGRRIVVSYWKDMESIYAWRDRGERAAARRAGADAWEELDDLEIVRVRERPFFATSKRVVNAAVNDGWGQLGALVVVAIGFAYRTF
ncbi:MAG: antibiotic biosynthesis monooxygenase [Rhodospirillales bacterium]|nr:antibiotic biosynthesis monooxygenase [Rhodospirillales bacterium]